MLFCGLRSAEVLGLEQATPAVHQFHASLGELDGVPGPREQPHLKEAFEAGDRLGPAGLGDVQAGGGAPEMQFLGDRGEVPQVAELDPRGPATRPGAGKAHRTLPEDRGCAVAGGPTAMSLCPSLRSCTLTCGDARG
jgi:hypothetical protein